MLSLSFLYFWSGSNKLDYHENMQVSCDYRNGNIRGQSKYM